MLSRAPSLVFGRSSAAIVCCRRRAAAAKHVGVRFKSLHYQTAHCSQMDHNVTYGCCPRNRAAQMSSRWPREKLEQRSHHTANCEAAPHEIERGPFAMERSPFHRQAASEK